MMKKRWKRRLFCLLAGAMMLALALAGCSEKEETAAGSYVAPAALTEGERELLDLVGVRDGGILEFGINDRVDTIRLYTYQLVDGAWERKGELGGFYGLTDSRMEPKISKGRVALVFDTVPQGVEVSMEAGATQATFRGESFEAPAEGGVMSTEFLGEKKEVEGTAEIPLMIQVIGENTLRTYSVEDFEDPGERLVQEDYLGVYAITLSFEEKAQ